MACQVSETLFSGVMVFEYPEDRAFFDDLLKPLGGVDKNQELFDFRDPELKRREFGKIRSEVFKSMVLMRGNICELRWNGNCTGNAENIDHLIPLSSNKLNKELRNVVPEKPKKVKSQSFGANSPKNFVLACAKCNGAKKHQFPSAEKFTELMGNSL